MTSLLRLTQWKHLAKATILLRTDLNIDFTKPQASIHPRFIKTIKTVQTLLNAGAHVLVLSHKGRPKGYNIHESLQPVIKLFARHAIAAVFASTIDEAASLLHTHTCVVLENLRFFDGEKNHITAHTFARALASCGTYFVQDAWANLHRDDSSMKLIPQFFNTEHKSCGFIVQEELEKLEKLKNHPEKPFVVIIGGGKGDEKLLLLQELCRNNPPTTLIVLPGLSPLHPTHPLKSLCKQKNITLLEPIDYLCAQKTWDGPLIYKQAQQLTINDICICAGPDSVKLFLRSINQAHSIFLNGMMGDSTRPETTQAFTAMLQSITNAHAYSVIGGGDTLAALQNFTQNPTHIFCSTGGGATLAYLAHQPLPGLQALE